jgi:glycosyltransferase involved in cell wall biosynthesis
VHFLGYRDDVKELLEITDIFLMPSLDEGLPMALLEAMAMRKSVVATPVGAIPSVVSDGMDAILVPAGKVEELEKAILHLIKDSTIREYLGRNAREKVVKKFSGDVMVTKYLEKYRGMITEI